MRACQQSMLQFDDPGATKRCCGCKRQLPLDAFHKSANLCKPCQSEYGKRWHAKNRERNNAGARSYYREHAKHLRELAHRHWFSKSAAERKRIGRIRKLKDKYGITPERYEEMLAAQDGVCTLCAKAPDGKILGVDHKHGTKQVRGLLCDDCNVMVGFVEKSLPMIDRIFEYIGHHH